MYFLTLVALQVLLVAGTASAESLEESLQKMMKKVVCEPEFAKIQNAMQQCTPEEAYATDNEIWKTCDVEMKSSDFDGLQDYYCYTPIEKLVKDNRCFSEKIIDLGKVKEMMERNMLNAECMKKVVDASRRK